MPEITDLTLLDPVADDDEIAIYDASAGTNNSKKTTRIQLLKDAPIESVLVSLTGPTGSVLQDLKAAAATVAPSDIAAGASETVVVAAANFETTDYFSHAFTQALPAGLICQPWISASGQVSFEFYNATASLISGASYTARMTAMTFQ